MQVGNLSVLASHNSHSPSRPSRYRLISSLSNPTKSLWDPQEQGVRNSYRKNYLPNRNYYLHGILVWYPIDVIIYAASTINLSVIIFHKLLFCTQIYRLCCSDLEYLISISRQMSNRKVSTRLVHFSTSDAPSPIGFLSKARTCYSIPRASTDLCRGSLQRL